MVDVVLDVDDEVLLEEVVLDDVVVDVDELDVLLLDVDDEVLLDDVDDEVLLDDVDVVDDVGATLVEVAEFAAVGELVDVADWGVTDVVAESPSDSGVTSVDDVDCNVVDSVVNEVVVSTMSLSLVESTADSC